MKYKVIYEITNLEVDDNEPDPEAKAASLAGLIIGQIWLNDPDHSLDEVSGEEFQDTRIRISHCERMKS
jgi:hypothetical protein